MTDAETTVQAGMPLERFDYILMAVGLAIALLVAILGIFLQWSLLIDIYLIWLMIIPALVGLTYVYRTVQLSGGVIGRGLSVIGLGLAIQILLFVPLVQWHLEGMPPWLGLETGAVFVLLHGMALVGFATTTYGFALFARGGR